VFNVGGPEVLVILLVALIVLGPHQLPKAARQVGQVMAEIRKVSSGFQRELTSALEAEEKKAQPSMKPQSPGGPQDVSPDATSPAEDVTDPPSAAGPADESD
jgi:sec-independent protein translocase protein TatB